MTFEKQLAIIKKAYPDLTVVEAYKYGSSFIFCAVKDPNTVDYNDPYYIVIKGKAYPFAPMSDFDGFQEALKHKIAIK